MKLIIDKNRKVYSAGTWGTKNENNYEILDFEFPEELEEYNKRIVYYLGNERVWDAIVYNKAYITNAITKYEKVNAYVWLTKNETITLKYVCDGTEEGNYYFTYDNVNYYFTMPEVEENDELIFDVATSTLKLDNTTIATTSIGAGTELTFETIIDAEEDFRTQLFEMQFYENENADGIVPTEQQVDGFNTMLTAMNNKIAEVNALEQTIGAAEAQRQDAEATRVSNENTRETNESTRQENEQTRQEQEAERERRTDEAIGNIEDKTAEYNANAEAKTTAFNNNATQKTNDFNSNYTQKVNDFNTNASSKELAFNSNTESKTSTFNTNATNKTNDFNSNATSKTTDFNTNAENKTTAFNDNATQKTTNFDNNASEKTDEFNTNAQEKIDEYDEHIVEYQAQIDELQEEVEELSQNMPWNETEQGTYLDITDSAKYSKNKMKLFGNTSQDSTSGSQAIDYSEVINREVNFNDVTLLISTTNFNIKADTTYYIRWIFTDNTYVDASSTLDNIRLYNGTSIQKQFGGTNMVFTSQELDGITSVQVRATSTFASTYAGKTIKALVFSSDSNKITPDTYEPYTNGASPNPDYPQDIHVVTGNNTIGVTGKNLLDLANKTGGSITLRKLPVKLKPGTYVFSCDDANASIAIRLSETNQTGSQSVVSTTNYTSGTRRYTTITTTFDAEYINISTSNIPATNMQLEEGSTLSSYEPYTHIDYSLNLGSLELCKIGNYQDYLYKENGNWYESKRINKYKLTSGFIDYGAIRNEVYRILTRQSGAVITPALNEKDTILTACTHFASITRNQSDKSNITTINSIAMLNIAGFMINLPKGSDLSSVSAFKTFVDNNDIIIYYILNTPTYTQITDETLISQLEAIYNHLALVKGINHITITPSDLEPYMKLNYMQDLPSKLDNLDSRLSLLE